MTLGTIRHLIAKDLFLFFQNRYIALVSVIGVVAYTIIFLVMPSVLDESLSLAIYLPGPASIIQAAIDTEGWEIQNTNSEDELRDLVKDGKVAKL